MENYQKINVVGRGAFGVVHLCERKSDKAKVIIKQITVDQMTKEERQLAVTEVRVLSMLSHPNIIQLYNNFLEDKALMIVMEYAEGGTLYEYLQSQKGELLDEIKILRHFVQILLAIQHIHSRQILHRDLKTQNILLDKSKEIIKVGDFGISKILSSKSKAFSVVGTPCYISPELCKGQAYNQKSDVWAVGCILYEMMTLQRAFHAENLPALVMRIMKGQLTSAISDKYSDELKDIVKRLLEHSAETRATVNQIMAERLILLAMIDVYCDLGSIDCTNVDDVRYAPNNSLTSLKERSSSFSRSSSSNNILSQSPKNNSCLVYWWGNGITEPSILPLPNNDTIIKQVCIGRTQKCAITDNGQLFIWDGDGSTQIPRLVDGESAVCIRRVACGDMFMAFLTDRGLLMTSGGGGSGCLGHGDSKDVQKAKIVQTLLGCSVIDIGCGSNHCVAVTSDAEIYSWGRSDNGRLGVKETTCINKPHLIVLDMAVHNSYKPSKVFCSNDATILLDEENGGKLLATGSNRHNKLGLDDERMVNEVYQFTWPFILRSEKVANLSTGPTHSAFVNRQGSCFAIGSNSFGQLGSAPCLGDRKLKSIEASLFNNGRVTIVSCGDAFTVAAVERQVEDENIAHQITLYSWGKESRGRLGRKVENGQQIPMPIKLPLNDDEKVVGSISAAHGSTLICLSYK